jgi:hypothetical protein
MATLHANTAREAVTKMCTLGLFASSKTSSAVTTRSCAGIAAAMQFSSVN